MYEELEETRCLEGIRYQAFGIVSPKGKRVGDLSSYKTKVVHFIEKLNHWHVSEIHLMDCINDFLLE